MKKLSIPQLNKELEHKLINIIDKKLKKDMKLINEVEEIRHHFKTHKWPLSYMYLKGQIPLTGIVLDTLLFKKLKLKIKYKQGSGLVVYK